MFYCIIHKDSGDVFNTYSGMAQDAILALWAPATVEFVDRDTWKTKSDAQA